MTTSKPTIQNVSIIDIKTGRYTSHGPNTVIIQILDPGTDPPKPKHDFGLVYTFKFLDIETDEAPFAISDLHAKVIATVLEESLEKGRNVVVHCHAGIVRSGAVVEAGVMLGFEDPKTYRNPNLLVLRKILKKIYSGDKQ